MIEKWPYFVFRIQWYLKHFLPLSTHTSVAKVVEIYFQKVALLITSSLSLYEQIVMRELKSREESNIGRKTWKDVWSSSELTGCPMKKRIAFVESTLTTCPLNISSSQKQKQGKHNSQDALYVDSTAILRELRCEFRGWRFQIFVAFDLN